MKQKSVGLTLRAAILALALILVAGSPALPPFDGVAYAQSSTSTLSHNLLPVSNNVQLDWTAVDGADSYRLWKGEGSGQSVSWGDSAHETFNEPTAHVDSAVTAGMTYSYVVEVYDGATRLGWSNVENVTIPGGTDKPTTKPAVTLAADGLSAITVSWTTVAGATHYQVRYWTVGLSGWRDIGGQESGPTYSHTGLTSGTQYFYIVRAVNDGGDGPWSGTPGNYASLALEATTTVPVLTLDHTARTTVELSWTRVSTSAMYILHRKKVTTIDAGTPTDSGWEKRGATMSSDTTMYTDASVMSDAADEDDNPATASSTVYHYRVQALENGVQGDWSNVKMATIPMSSALPTTPAGLAATPIASDRINVAWSPVAGADRHEIQYKMGDGSYMAARTATAPYLHTGLNADTKYTYQVRSVNVNGPSDWSGAVNATTLAATSTAERLGVPTGLRAVDATTTADSPVPGIKVTWNAVSKATGYELRKWSGTEWDVVALDATAQAMRSVTDLSSIAAGMTYYYIVAALDNNGTVEATDDDMSDWSSPAMGMTKAAKPAAAPEGLAATPRGEDIIWVSWSEVDGAQYTLQWRRVPATSWNSIPVVEGRLTHPHTGLTPGREYSYRVRAENSGGMSVYSGEVQGTTWARQLATPTNVKAEDATDGTTARIKLSWDAVSGASVYEVQKWVANSWVLLDLDPDDDGTMATTETSYTDNTGVAEDMTYYYIVRAVSGSVTSRWSGFVSGMTKPEAPGAGPTLHLDPTGQNRVRLTWSAVAGATGYELEYIEGDLDVFTSLTSQMSITLPTNPMYYTQRNLKPGTRYSYRMQATLPQGVLSGWSDVEQIITRPATPMMTASSDTSTIIILKWDLVKPTGLADSDATAFNCAQYDIQRRKFDESMWVNVDDNRSLSDDGSICSITDNGEASDNDGLDMGTLYYYRLRVATTPTADTGHPAIKSYWETANARTPSQ